MENGTHAVYFNNRKHGDDNYLMKVLSPHSVLDAVFDGVSSGGQGGKASTLTKHRLRDASRIEGPEDVERLLGRANDALFNKPRRPLTTATVALKIEDQLYVINVGDSPAYLFRDGRVEELTTLDKEPYSLAGLTQTIGDGRELTYHRKQIILKPGDRLVLATDGITDNIHPNELYERVIRDTGTPEEAVGRLEKVLKEKRRKNEGREDFFKEFKNDDQTAIIRFV